jgi:hypothetical protein
MVLKFGDLVVSNGDVLPLAKLNVKPTYHSLYQLQTTVLLYDRANNYLHWIMINGFYDLFPYLPLTRESQYALLEFDSRNTDIRKKDLRRENFTTQLSIKELGKLKNKIMFYTVSSPVVNTSFSKLPVDLLMHEALKMPVTQIHNICKADQIVDKSLCRNKEFLRRLVRKYLTTDDELAIQISNKYHFYSLADVIKTLYSSHENEVRFQFIDLYPFIKFLDLILIREITREKALNNGNLGKDEWISSKLMRDIVEIDKDSNFLLKLFPKIYSNTDLRQIYPQLLNYAENSNKTREQKDMLIDNIINQMDDDMFNELLNISYSSSTRSLLNILLRYIPQNEREEYSARYIEDEDL